MGEIGVVIEGKSVTGSEGMTILEAAKKIGIHIPTLCHIPELKPTGACRICVVEVEGQPRLVGACHTPIAEGMVIWSHSHRVMEARKMALELMMAGHTGPCVNDNGAENCDLHLLAAELELAPPRVRVRRPRFYPVEALSPYVRRDLSKCILCRRCVEVCRELARKNVYSVGYRGFDSKVIVDCDEPLNKEDCRDCGICVDYCPTNALTSPARPEKKTVKGGRAPGETLNDKSQRGQQDRSVLLALLKAEQEKSGFVSRETIRAISRNLQIGVGETYGVATFYSFISTRPTGRNVIRVCKSLPCSMKDSRMILDTIGKAIGIMPGETTPDRRYSLELTNCIGACDQAPAMLVNHDLHGHLSAEKIPAILESYV